MSLDLKFSLTCILLSVWLDILIISVNVLGNNRGSFCIWGRWGVDHFQGGLWPVFPDFLGPGIFYYYETLHKTKKGHISQGAGSNILVLTFFYSLGDTLSENLSPRRVPSFSTWGPLQGKGVVTCFWHAREKFVMQSWDFDFYETLMFSQLFHDTFTALKWTIL